MMRRGILRLAAITVLLRLLHAVHAQQLSPLGTAANPFGSTEVHQMAFDLTNRTLYLANTARHTIIQVASMSSAPLTPSALAPWVYDVFVGWDGINGLPSSSEVPPTVARLKTPSGISGWPQYAVGPYSTAADDEDSVEPAWVGLWLADRGNNALRFIHFARGNNVTLVAGSSTGVGGTQDGIGAAASLWNPNNLAWGRFLRNSVTAASSASWSSSRHTEWTSVLFWSQSQSHCLRQGVPLLLLNGPAGDPSYFNATTSAMDLRTMALNVSNFAGVCGGTSGSGTGLVYNQSGMLSYPIGVALVVPVPRPSAAALRR